ncbi:hypothetical protein [Pontibacter liquoris]|uniref:hypothetical protein n=1 Tax=Pontibacter liquoris TaxID=2905677 RepID=UPI001FA7FEB3|nr:hypothetical protein [Pontibacter liquoris]
MPKDEPSRAWSAPKYKIKQESIKLSINQQLVSIAGIPYLKIKPPTRYNQKYKTTVTTYQSHHFSAIAFHLFLLFTFLQPCFNNAKTNADHTAPHSPPLHYRAIQT